MITQEMIDYCRGLGNRKIKPHYRSTGLCDNFFTEFRRRSLYRYIDFNKYPNHSGFDIHPIKSMCKKYPDIMYYHCQTQNKLWDARTSYGKERLKFCLWCADELERNMRKQQ